MALPGEVLIPPLDPDDKNWELYKNSTLIGYGIGGGLFLGSVGGYGALEILGLISAAGGSKIGNEVAANANKAAPAFENALSETQSSVYDKLVCYLLNPDHPIGRNKAEWFKQALGYTKDNMSDLAKQLVFDSSKAVQTAVTEYGTKFNKTISITGTNGKVIDVATAWIRNNNGIVRFVTAIPTKK